MAGCDRKRMLGSQLRLQELSVKGDQCQILGKAVVQVACDPQALGSDCLARGVPPRLTRARSPAISNIAHAASRNPSSGVIQSAATTGIATDWSLAAARRNEAPARRPAFLCFAPGAGEKRDPGGASA